MKKNKEIIAVLCLSLVVLMLIIFSSIAKKREEKNQLEDMMGILLDYRSQADLSITIFPKLLDENSFQINESQSIEVLNLLIGGLRNEPIHAKRSIDSLFGKITVYSSNADKYEFSIFFDSETVYVNCLNNGMFFYVIDEDAIIRRFFDDNTYW